MIASEHQRDDLDSEEFVSILSGENERERDFLWNYWFLFKHDKSLPNYENVNELTNTNSLDVSEKDLLEKLKINNKSSPTIIPNGNIHVQQNNTHHQSVSITYDSDNQSNQVKQVKHHHQSDSKHLNIKLNNNNKNIPNQITISDNKNVYVNDNNSSSDLENRQAFPLKSLPPSSNIISISSSSNNSKKATTTLSGSSSNSITSQNTTSLSTIINNTTNESNKIIVDNKNIKNSSSSSIVDNNNNVNFKINNQQNGVIITTQVQPSVITRNSIKNDNKHKPSVNNMIAETNNNRFNNNNSKFIPIIDTDGVKYKFKSDETIGGKSDVSNDRSSKFTCTKCLNCSIM